MGAGGQRHAPAALPLGALVWAPGPVWIGAENLTPLEFDPQTFQPVVSRYTDYAIPTPRLLLVIQNILLSKW
jgi:hypothetical protein